LMSMEKTHPIAPMLKVSENVDSQETPLNK